MAFKMNKVKVDLCSYGVYVVYGLPKVGKSTLFRDLVLYNYKDASKGLLISVSDEEGYHALDDLQVAVASTWNEDFDEDNAEGGLSSIVDYIVENNKELGLKMVCFDTYDKMVDIAISEVLRLSKKETGTPCKSINDAFGGWGNGRSKLKDLIREQISKLRSAGIAVFFLSHCKVKEKTDMITGEAYDQLTNNLSSDYWSVIADIAQMICAINIEKEIEGGKLLDSTRMMHFTSSGIIECGSRFAGMPEKLELSAENFMKAFEIGVKNSMGEKKTDEEIEKQKIIEEEELKTRAEVAKSKIQEESLPDIDNKQLVSQIQKAVNDKTINMADMKTLMKKHGIKKFSDAESLPTEGLLEIVELIK